MDWQKRKLFFFFIVWTIGKPSLGSIVKYQKSSCQAM